MTTYDWDERRKITIPGDKDETILFCAQHFAECAKKAIEDHGAFYVALSGGSTPKAIYNLLCKSYLNKIDWSKVHLFWSDERNVPPSELDSNYNMALRSGFDKISIPKENIHRMVAENEIEQNALEYEKTIDSVLKGAPFDLIMLGMGDDGHTASLFPGTLGLKEASRSVIANFVPQKNAWRMTMTFPLINQAKNIAIYVIGDSKKERILSVLSEKDESKLLPSARVGSKEHPALWIADKEASSLIASHLR